MVKQSPALAFCDNAACMIWRGGSREFGRCKGCNLSEYCSRECQKQAWPSHRGECRKAQAYRRMLSDEERQLWNDLQRWAARHRAQLYHGMLTAFDLERRPEAHTTHLVGAHLRYSVDDAERGQFVVTAIEAMEWSRVVNSCKPFVKRTFDGIYKKRAALEREACELARDVVHGVGMVVLLVDLDPAGSMVMELPYRVQSTDISRHTYDTTGWAESLRRDLDKVS